MIFFFVLIFLNEGIFESSEILRAIDKPVNVVFKFSFVYDVSSVRTFIKGGSFVVEDLALD
jgi:hypothetical protein